MTVVRDCPVTQPDLEAAMADHHDPNDDRHDGDARRLADLLRRPRMTWSMHLDEEGRSTAAFTSAAAADRPALSSLPVRYDGRSVAAAGKQVECASTHPDDVLAAFIELVRRMRSGSGGTITGFRRGDVDELAAVLGLEAQDVLARLAVLLGASRTRSEAMAAAYVAGTSEIPCAGEAREFGPSLVSQRLSG